MFKDKRWVKRYKEDGMASSAIPKPRLIYKPIRQSTLSEKEPGWYLMITILCSVSLYNGTDKW